MTLEEKLTKYKVNVGRETGYAKWIADTKDLGIQNREGQDVDYSGVIPDGKLRGYGNTPEEAVDNLLKILKPLFEAGWK